MKCPICKGSHTLKQLAELFDKELDQQLCYYHLTQFVEVIKE
jgi:hypothetical protein